MVETPSENRFRCCLIGGTALLIHCATRLRKRGHTTLAIVTDDPAVRKWARTQSTARMWSSSEIELAVRENEFDYLFSIANEHILNDDILALPQQLAINYHDSLLPEFAGRNATAWAIYHRKAIHGTTWHTMVPAVDAGDVLVQESVQIAPDDNTFTLNVKCFKSAITGFDKLLTQIESGCISCKPQNAAHRSYSSSTQRLPNGGVIDWSMSADHISAMVRAADFGPHPCEIGVAKAQIGGEWVVIKAASPTAKPSLLSPGTIAEVRDTHIVVATGENELNIFKLQFLDGPPLELADSQRLLGIQEGTRFGTLGHAAQVDLSRRFPQAAKHESYWVSRLAALRPVGLRDLNTCGPGAHRIQETACETCVVPEDITRLWEEKISAISRNNFCATAFAAYLARVTGTYDLDYGVILATPISPAIEIGGLFSDCLPMHISLDQTTSGAELARKMEIELDDLQRRGLYPREIHGRYPGLTESAFPFVLDLSGGRDDALHPNGEIVVSLATDGSRLRWIYNPIIFARNDIIRFMQQFLRIARALAMRPNDAIATLDILSEEERRLQAVEPNASAHSADGLTVHEMFEGVVARFPDHIAIYYDQTQMTYARLEEQSSLLASKLSKIGVGRGDIVALLADRSIEWIVGILGVLKAGAAYLPLDVTEPESRLNQVIKESGARLALCTSRQRKTFIPQSVQVLFVDCSAVTAELAKAPTLLYATENGTTMQLVPRVVSPDDPAYVIYTSGSTGRPKGTVISHRALSYFIREVTRMYEISHQDRILQLCATSFDAAVEEVFSALTTGATLVLRTPDMAQSLIQFFARCREWQLTVIGLFAAQIRDAIAAMDADNAFPETIRLVTTGGESVHVEDIVRWQSFFAVRGLRPPRLLNVYGLTEATIASIVCDLTNRKLATQRVPIGRPIPGTTVRILDPNKQPVPICVPGEIHISGPGLADRYLNRPEATNERFVSDPFAPKSRMLATGDHGRFLPDGCIEFLGRQDQQVKVQGYRVELGEIEAVLCSHPSVRKAAVAKRVVLSDERLIAYIVQETERPEWAAAPEAEIAVDWLPKNTAQILQKFLSERLPSFMIPHVYCEVSDLPLDAHGKVKKDAIPEPTWSTSFPALNSRDDVESLLIDLWQRTLGISRIGVRDNYFDLGGDSLAAIDMLLSIQTTSGVRLSLEQLFQCPTIMELTELINRERHKEQTSLIGSRQRQRDHFHGIQAIANDVQSTEGAANVFAFRGHGSRNPIYLLHGPSGDVNGFLQLINALGNDQPVYGVQSPALHRPEDVPRSMEEAAANIIRQIRKNELHMAPAFLGYSWSGLLAFEVALQWAAECGERPFVGLIGTAPPIPRLTVSRRIAHYFRWLPNWLLSGGASWLHWRKRFTQTPQYIRRIRNSFRSKPEIPDWAANTVSKNYLTLGFEYAPRIDQTILIDLFRPISDRPPAGHPLVPWEFAHLPDGGWATWVGLPPKVHWLEGDHVAILCPPHVRELAAQIRAAMDAHYSATPLQTFGDTA